MDINKMDVAALIKLRAEIDAVLPKKKDEQVAGVQNAVRKLVEDSGFSLDEILSPLIAKPEKAQSVRKQVQAKYSKGENMWSGRGKRPKWVIEHIEKGGTLEELRIK